MMMVLVCLLTYARGRRGRLRKKPEGGRIAIPGNYIIVELMWKT